jgi:hypothetical protein
MNSLDTILTVTDQVMLLPDQYLRQGITILRSVVYLARMEDEGRREQALLVRQALESNVALVGQSAEVTAADEPEAEAPPSRPWSQDFRAGDPDRQHVVASEAETLIAAFEAIMSKLQYTNVTERQLVVEVRSAIARVRAMGNHEPSGEESAAAG